MRADIGYDKKNELWFMNQFFVISNLFILIIGVILVFGVPDHINKTGQAQSSGRWIDFSSTIGDFKIRMPSYPKAMLVSSENPYTTYVSTASDGMVYSVSFSDAPFNSKVSDPNASLKDSVDIHAAMVGGRVLNLKYNMYRGYPIVDSTIKTGPVYLSHRSVLAGHRMYSLVIQSRTNPVRSFDNFYNSFEITE